MKLLASATPEEWEFPTDPVINLAPGFPMLGRATWDCIAIPWRMISPRLCLGLRMALSEHSESTVSLSQQRLHLPFVSLREVLVF